MRNWRLLPGALTPSLQEDLVRLGAWMPFARAAGELARFRGTTVSEATARGRAEAAGAAYVAVQAAAGRAAGAGGARRRRPARPGSS